MKTPTSFFKKTVLVPIPLHWTRKFARGFNQSELMAQTIAKYASLLVSTNLKRIRRTPQQARLSKKEREGNIQHAFVWKGDAIPRNITLIDDVVASGSTLEEAARILKQAGVKKVQAVVFARGGNRNRQGTMINKQ
ncbi:ComF family protein [Candidatus Gracilibacteria bacterium]|nr:ComF family protein [Candidatus Gracilibacteria bacterium]